MEILSTKKQWVNKGVFVPFYFSWNKVLTFLAGTAFICFYILFFLLKIYGCYFPPAVSGYILFIMTLYLANWINGCKNMHEVTEFIKNC